MHARNSGYSSFSRLKITLMKLGLSAVLSLALSVPALADDWSGTIAAVTLNNRLYTVHKGGELFSTDLKTGRWIQIGKPEFGKTKFLFAGPQNLYTIEQDGTLYKVSPSTGAWSSVGKPGDYKNTVAGAFVGGFLYTVETNGALYKTGPANGTWVQVGRPEFANTTRLFSTSDALYTIERDGSLYWVNPATGAWKPIGEAGGWKNTIAGTFLNGKIYTVEKSGALYETNPATGVWRQIGKPEFGKTKFLFSANGSLYSMEAGGIYIIDATTGTWVTVG